jgi:two-component system sensor histidine kinase DegS
MIKTNVPLELSQRYLGALRGQLGFARRHPGATAEARALGREAIAAGCNTLELAQMHERALIALAQDDDFSKTRSGLRRRTTRFFTEMLGPIEKSHQTTKESLQQAHQSAANLRQHTAELAKINRSLVREVARRKTSEQALLVGKEHNRQLLAQSNVMQKKLRSLAHQILSVQENERSAISRELHDEVVQMLVGVNVELTTMGKAATLDIDTFNSKILKIQRLVKKSVIAVHQFARGLRPAVLDDLGLIPALKTIVKSVATRHKLLVQFTAFVGVENMPEAHRIALYRVAVEAITNITRHSKASRVEMSILKVPGAIRMEIHDNGKTFDVSHTLNSRTNKRLGLICMRERIEMVGGTLSIESEPDKGTTVRAEIPFNPKGSL